MPHARSTRTSPLITPQIHNDDEAHLAKLGYKQDLNRSWSGFSNFAISFSIISILAGCFTNFGAGFNNGGPISISWSWPILGVFILIIGFTMSELVSAYPTSGGIYWWASKLGGPAAGFFTGWLNLIGLVAVTAGVSYGCATFIDLTISTYSESYAADYSLTRVFIIFVVVLALVSVLNIFSSHLMAIMNNVSVWWHVVGASRDRADPDLRARPAPVVQLRLHRAVQQLRLLRRRAPAALALLVRDRAVRLPADAVHDHRLRRLRPPVRGDRRRRRRRRPRASGARSSTPSIGGYILLLCVVFAIPNDADGAPDNAGVGGGGVAYIFVSALGKNWATFVLFISASAQFFCATSCMTSASRMTFAFSRDGAIPGSRDLVEADRARGCRPTRSCRRGVRPRSSRCRR